MVGLRNEKWLLHVNHTSIAHSVAFSKVKYVGLEERTKSAFACTIHHRALRFQKQLE